MVQTDNPEALKTVDSALFVVALDDEKPSTVEGLTRQFLLGDGRNRWFDKSYVPCAPCTCAAWPRRGAQPQGDRLLAWAADAGSRW